MEPPGMAGGSLSKEELLIARMPITCHGRIAVADVMIQPSRTSGHFLIGYNYMKLVGLVIDTSNDSWHFANSPSRKIPMRMKRSEIVQTRRPRFRTSQVRPARDEEIERTFQNSREDQGRSNEERGRRTI